MRVRNLNGTDLPSSCLAAEKGGRVAKDAPSAEVVEQLAVFFRRNGYVRRPNPDRLAAEADLPTA